MNIALVTGATSGIGYEIAKKLLEMNYTVYGFGRNFIKNKKRIFEIDLVKLDQLEKTLHQLKKNKVFTYCKFSWNWIFWSARRNEYIKN